MIFPKLYNNLQLFGSVTPGSVQFKWLLPRFSLEANLKQHWWKSIKSVQTNHQLLFCLKMNFLMTIKSLIISVCIKQCFGGTKPTFFGPDKYFFSYFVSCPSKTHQNCRTQGDSFILYYLCIQHSRAKIKKCWIMQQLISWGISRIYYCNLF